VIATPSAPESSGDPIVVVGPLPAGTHLGPLEIETGYADVELKNAVLLSGVFASGVTRFKEPTVSRDHFERLLAARAVPIRTVGPIVEIDPSRWDGRMAASDVDVPGDLSAAAFLIAAAQVVPGSRVTARDVGVNPTRAGLLEIARDMGAGLAVEPQGDRNGEPVAVLHAWAGAIRGARVGGETIARAASEVPVLCALGARAHGATRIMDVSDLRTPGADRIGAMERVLRAFGVACHARPDGIDIEGQEAPLATADVDAGGDPEIAMTAAILGLVAAGPARVRGAECIAPAYPKFVATLRGLGARIELET
jgi:3-phosphoshikimate 1-carboxyvinyltransferase